MIARDKNGHITPDTVVRVNVAGFFVLMMGFGTALVGATLVYFQLREGVNLIHQHVLTEQHPEQAKINAELELKIFKLQSELNSKLDQLGRDVTTIKRDLERERGR